MIWELSLAMAEEMDRQVATSLFERLSDDPHVEEVELAECSTRPFTAVLRVTFRRGYEQPYDPDLRRVRFTHDPAEPPTGLTAYDLLLDAPDAGVDRE